MTFQTQQLFSRGSLFTLLLGAALISPAAVQDSFFDGVLDLANLNGANGFVLNGIDSGDQ